MLLCKVLYMSFHAKRNLCINWASAPLKNKQRFSRVKNCLQIQLEIYAVAPFSHETSKAFLLETTFLFLYVRSCTHILEMKVTFPNKRSKPFRKERNSTFRFKRVTAASRKENEAFSCGAEPKNSLEHFCLWAFEMSYGAFLRLTSSSRRSAKFLDDKRQFSPI